MLESVMMVFNVNFNGSTVVTHRLTDNHIWHVLQKLSTDHWKHNGMTEFQSHLSLNLDRTKASEQNNAINVHR